PVPSGPGASVLSAASAQSVAMKPATWYSRSVMVVVLLVSASTLSQKTSHQTLSEIMDRITELTKRKVPLCEEHTVKDDYVMTQVKALQEITEFQNGVLSDLRYMASKLSENIDEYLPGNLRTKSASVTSVV
ncbi:hypothetical protein OTU49_000727, partial [Cherax quadricarinatus]